MSIRIRVLPEPNSIGARRNRAIARQEKLANAMLNRQLAALRATTPGGNPYLGSYATGLGLGRFGFNPYNTGITGGFYSNYGLGHPTLGGYSPYGYGAALPYGYNPVQQSYLGSTAIGCAPAVRQSSVTPCDFTPGFVGQVPQYVGQTPPMKFV